ncbi:hypothetical protein Tco_0502813 [Tanacetum coccineum]
MCKEEEKQKSIDTVEYEYGDIDLEFEEEDEDEDEYDGIYRELEEENIDNFDKEDFEQVEELKPLCVSSWIHPKSGETRHGIEVVARKDDAQVDFDDYTNLCLATRINRIRYCLPCGHVYGMSCIRTWFEIASRGTVGLSLPSRPIYETRICNLASDQKVMEYGSKHLKKESVSLYQGFNLRHFNLSDAINIQMAPIRRFSFSRLGYIAFKKYEFARRNYAWDKRFDALKQRADVVRRHNDAMKRRSELLDRRANVLKRANALEHRDIALRRANSLRLRADALGRRAEEYLRSAKTFKLRAKALHEKARAFGLQVDAFKPRLKFFEDSHSEFYGFGITERTHTGQFTDEFTLVLVFRALPESNLNGKTICTVRSQKRTVPQFTNRGMKSTNGGMKSARSIDKNHRTCLFSLSERLKADNTVRVNQIVTVFLIESPIHLLDQYRYPVDTSLIHIESHKSPTAVLFDDDTGRISIRYREYLRVSL